MIELRHISPVLPFDTLHVLAVGTLILVLHLLRQHLKLSHIPTVGGSSLPIISYKGSLRFISNSKRVLQEGYAKHRGRIFKVAMLDRWLLVVTGPQLIEELRAMPEEDFSLHESLCQIFEMDYTLGPSIREDPYHAHLLHSHLTKKLDNLFPLLNAEITAALGEYLDLIGDDWRGIPLLDVMRKVVCRATNRTIVGIPTCRDEEYLSLQLNFATDVTKGRLTLNLLPRVLKPLAGRFLTTVPIRVAQCLRFIEPILEERKRSMAEHGIDFPDKPDDMLQWFMDAAFGHSERFANRELAIRVLVLNFASIHTTSNSVVHCLYHLAVDPVSVDVLRKELEDVITTHGWTKAAMARLHLMDSVLRETARFTGLNGLSITRIAVKPHTFRDGTFVPRGAFLGCPTSAVHADELNYPSPHLFKPFRFVDATDKDSVASKQTSQFASTRSSYIPFGHGKSACPGRFFASVEMKAIIAHIILNYDMRTQDGLRPPDKLLGITTFPSAADILFRKRSIL